ncbi:alpha/beta hydrolase [Myxococcus sp. 1LA]
MKRQPLKDGEELFDVLVLDAPRPGRTVLFAVGGGGSPERHLPLLTSLMEHGCTVVAPYFERLTLTPTEGDLLLRARRLRIALDAVATPGIPVVGVGHSIGTTMLLAFAGGQPWMRAGQRLGIEADPRLERLVLLGPATGYFQAPGALSAVRTPILAWAGANDMITPPAQAELLKKALGAQVPLDLRVVEGAGHFSFMHTPPPQATDSLPNREAFLAILTPEVCRFVMS